MATPAEPATTPSEDPQGAVPAPESTPPAPQDPAPTGSAPVADDGLPRAMPDGVQVSGRKGGQPPADADPKTPAQPADSPSPQAEPETPTEDGKYKRPEVSDLPDWAQKLIKDAREDAAKARTTAKQQAADEAAAAATKKVTEDIGRALGLITDDDPGEEQLTPEQLQDLLGNERKSTKMAKTELAVFKAAQGGNFNVNALLDSKSFLDSLADVDPSDSGAVAKKIEATLEASPWLRTSAAPAATEETPAAVAPVTPAVIHPATPSGGSFAGGPGARSQDASTMTIDDFRALRRGK